MEIRPELMALRADDSRQRRTQQRLVAQSAAWRHAGPGAAIEAELPNFARGIRLDRVPALSALFTPGSSAAAELVETVVNWLLIELSTDPLSQVPFRHQCDRSIATLQLARCHGASLALQAVDCAGLARKAPPVSVSFAANDTWDHVLAGAAEVEQVRIVGQGKGGAVLERQRASIAAGTLASRCGQRHSQLLLRVPGVLVTLKLQRSDRSGAPTREYALDDGRLLRQAAGDLRDSRLELTAALLGRMGRTDAAPLLAAMAGEPGSGHLRWQALRECLGLDSAVGFGVLSEIACRKGDPLGAPAEALRVQLLAAHPQLAAFVRCRT